MLGTELPCIVQKLLQKRSAEPLPARVRNNGDVEDLRFARREHQDAVRDNAALALRDASRISGCQRVTKVPERPRRGVNLRLQRRDISEIITGERTPDDACGRGLGK